MPLNSPVLEFRIKPGGRFEYVKLVTVPLTVGVIGFIATPEVKFKVDIPYDKFVGATTG